VSIERRKGKFVLVCDFCGDEPVECDSWDEAVKAKKELGFKSTLYRTETEDVWQDLCADCAES
jgi:formylglycine-generating enzyme required for sulfatase activity